MRHGLAASLRGVLGSPQHRGRRLAAVAACGRGAWARRWHRHDAEVHETRLFGQRVAYRGGRALNILIEEIFVDGCYEFAATREDPVILDAGANIGMATLAFKLAYPRARITCFEPDPDAFALLRRNVESNGLEDVRLEQAGLSDAAGTLSFYPSEPRTGALTSSVLPERASGDAIEVPAVRLSDYIDGDIDLLKLDVEGAEHEVVSDLAKSGTLGRIRRIIMEYHHHLRPDDDRFSRMLGTLETNGFGYRLGAQAPARGGDRGFQDVLVVAYRHDV